MYETFTYYYVDTPLALGACSVVQAPVGMLSSAVMASKIAKQHSIARVVSTFVK